MSSAAARVARPPLLDPSWLLVGPAVLFLLLLFVYPFLYGFALSFQPMEGGWLANYQNYLSFTFDGALPVVHQEAQFLLPPNEVGQPAGRCRRAEPPAYSTRPDHAVEFHRLSDPF